MRRILVLPPELLDELGPSFAERPSFEVRTVPTVAAALGMTAVWPPELIIFGDDLPDSDPRNLCDHVRADRRLAGVKLLLVSSFLPGDEVGSEILHARLDGHLVQPVGADKLIRTIGVLLDVQHNESARLPQELLARVDIPAHVNVPGRAMLANVLGLCETGLSLECEDKLRTGEIITITFALPDTGTQIAARTMVLASDELQLHYRCEFLDCSPEEKIAIRQYVIEQVGPDGVAP